MKGRPENHFVAISVETSEVTGKTNLCEAIQQFRAGGKQALSLSEGKPCFVFFLVFCYLFFFFSFLQISLVSGGHVQWESWKEDNEGMMTCVTHWLLLILLQMEFITHYTWHLLLLPASKIQHHVLLFAALKTEVFLLFLITCFSEETFPSWPFLTRISGSPVLNSYISHIAFNGLLERRGENEEGEQTPSEIL